jgi:hypothetical protein
VDETRLDDGTCQPPGVSACGSGFASDGQGGCDAILPSTDCPAGQMAVPGDTSCHAVGAPEPPTCPSGTMAAPGETACHEVVDCGAAPWGNIPVGATTQYVDASYAGGNGDGSAAKPWTTIGAAVAASYPGAVIAVAAGSYAENVNLARSNVSLWGRCPRLVEIAGSDATGAAVTLNNTGDELHGVAVRGTGFGIGIFGDGSVVDGVWVHDTARIGVDSLAKYTLGHALVEHAGYAGILVEKATATIDGIVVRDTQPAPDGSLGYGMEVDAPGTLSVQSALIERTSGAAFSAQGGTATVQGTVLRDTVRNTQTQGVGVLMQPNASGTPANLTLTGSTLRHNEQYGVRVGSSTAVIDSTLVADTVAGTDSGGQSAGVVSSYNTGGTFPAPDVTVRASLLENNAYAGIGVTKGTMHVLSSVIRDTQTLATGFAGVAVSAADTTDLTIRGSLIERNHGVSVGAVDTDVTIDSTLVRETLPSVVGGGLSTTPTQAARSTELTGSSRTPQVAVTGSVFEGGAGIGLLLDGAAGTLTGVVVRNVASDTDRGWGVGVGVESGATAAGSLQAQGLMVDGTVAIGIFVEQAQANLTAVHVRNVATDASGGFGDGITVDGSTASVTQARIEGAPRAGISAFGSQVTLDSVAFTCDAIPVDEETVNAIDSAYDFAGPASCACNDASQQCQVLSSSLATPQPIHSAASP